MGCRSMATLSLVYIFSGRGAIGATIPEHRGLTASRSYAQEPFRCRFSERGDQALREIDFLLSMEVCETVTEQEGHGEMGQLCGQMASCLEAGVLARHDVEWTLEDTRTGRGKAT